MASSLVFLSLCVVAQGLELEKNWTTVQNLEDDVKVGTKAHPKLRTEVQEELLGSKDKSDKHKKTEKVEADSVETEKARREARARTEFLKKELQDLIAYKAKNKKPENVMQKAPTNVRESSGSSR